MTQEPPTPPTKLQEAIRAYMAREGVSARELSAKAGLGEKAVNDILLGRSKHPRIDTVLAIANQIGADVDFLMSTVKAAERFQRTVVAEAKSTPLAVPPLPSRSEAPRDVPVYGTARGANGEGAFELNQLEGALDYVPRLPGIMGNRKAFGIYVEGDSMHPRFKPGELVYVDPVRPARAGDDVVIVVEAEERGRPPLAYLKHLVRRGPDRIIVEQYNPAREIEFDAARVRTIYRVLLTTELVGA